MISSRVNPRVRTIRDLARLTPRDMRKMTAAMDRRFRRNESRLFASEGSSGGKRWPRLSPRYRRWKRRHHGSKKIMNLSGRTRKSLTHRGAEHVARWYLRPRAAVIVGSAVETALYHSGPTKNPNLPERDVIQFTQAQASEYLDACADVMRDKLKRYVRALASAARARGR